MWRSIRQPPCDAFLRKCRPLKNEDIIGENYDFREYFKHHKESSTSHAYISPVFVSANDDRYKFMISAPVRDDEGKLLGVVGVTVSAASKLGKGRLNKDEDLTAVLVARLDPSWDFALTGVVHNQRPDPEYVIFTHPAYDEEDYPRAYDEGDHPNQVRYVEKNSSLLAAFESNQDVDKNYKDPLLEGHWTAVSTRVSQENQNFLVIVQQRRD